MRSRGYLSLVLVALVGLSALALSGCSCARARRISPEEYRGDGPTSPLPKQEPAGTVLSRAEEIEIFKNSNDGVVRAGSTKPVTFTLAQQTSISYIQTYHWDSGKPPGEISLRGEDGTIYGPWKAVGTEGQGGMPNAYWEVTPNQSLKPGTYTVVDSDPGSWSTNDQMGGLGQTIVRGYSEE
jgi:hypothetical protein